MKASLSLVAVLAAVASACKCVDSKGKNDMDFTVYCCGAMRGHMDGDDCPASNISDKLTEFDYCCYTFSKGIRQSDCSHRHAHPPPKDS